jgi:hypothetical protein
VPDQRSVLSSYLLGTPRAQLNAYERRLLEGDWQKISGEVEVQLN